MRFRPYKSCDAEVVLSWCRDELTFRLWSADRYPTYPITPDEMNHKYIGCNGDCPEPDNFYPMTLCDENGPVGHLILRYTDAERKVMRLGFVVVDDTKRGCGYGKRLVRTALQYAFDYLDAEKVTIGVFEDNASAYHCYRAAGFREISVECPEICRFCGKDWRIRELEITKREYHCK